MRPHLPTDDESQQSIPRWRIWYDDDSYFSGTTEKEWDSLPRHGVLIVRQKEPNGWIVHMGLDYYWLEYDTIKSCNRNDIDRYLERACGIRCVKFGRWANNHVWERVHKESKKPCKDCD